MKTIALLLIAGLTSVGQVQAETLAGTNAAPPIAATSSVPDERDRQVLEATLLRLLIDPDFNLARNSTNKATIVLNSLSPEKTGMIRPEQMAGDIGEGHSIPSDVQDDLRQRNEKPGTYESRQVSFADLKFNHRIIVTNLSVDQKMARRSFITFKKAYPKARGFVETWLPGYSKDGSHAIVRAWVGPSDHGAVVTALLERKGDKWVVSWHNVAHFM